jgi:hypothetical protein
MDCCVPSLNFVITSVIILAVELEDAAAELDELELLDEIGAGLAPAWIMTTKLSIAIHLHIPAKIRHKSGRD